MPRSPRTRRVRRVARTGAALAALAAAVACGGDSTAPPAQHLDANQTRTVGVGVASEIEGLLMHLTLGAVNTGVPLLRARPGIALRYAGLRDARPGLGARDPRAFEGGTCPAVSPTQVLDPDGDLVPNTVTLTYDAAVCHFAFTSGFIEFSGILGFSDPQPSHAGIEMDANANAFDILVHDNQSTRDVTVRQTGDWSVSGPSTSVGATQDITTTYALTGNPDVVVHSTWAASFTPETGSDVAVPDELPNGEFTADGSIRVQSAGDDFDLSLTTVTPLQYDATCATNATVTTLRSGEVHAVLTGSNGRAYVKITWQNCGLPSWVFVSTSG